MLLPDFFTIRSRTSLMIALAGMCVFPCASMAQGEDDISRFINQQAFGAVAEILDRGDAAYNKSDMKTAVQEYDKARQEANERILPKSYKVQLDARYAQALAQLARQEAFQGKVDLARPKIEEAFKLAPEAPGVAEAKEIIDDPVRTNHASTAEHVENVKAVSALLNKAYGHYQLGQYDEAIANYTAVLRIDSYNAAARRGMEMVNNAKKDYSNASRDEYRSEALLQAAGGWAMPVAPKEAITGLIDPNEEFSSSITKDALVAQANRLIIPRINMEGVTLQEAVNYIRNQARQLDPNKKGFNILIDVGSYDSPEAQEILTRQFNLNLNNIPVSEALRHVAEMTGTNLRNTQHTIKIVSAAKDTGTLMNRNFSVPAGFFSGGADESSENSNPFSMDSGGGMKIKRTDPKTFLEKSGGVNFPEGAMVSYNAGSSTLIVRNTPANLSIIEEMIMSFSQKSPAQVVIKTTFVEVNVSKLKELGFDWIIGFSKLGGNANRLLGGGTDPSGSILGDMPSAPEDKPHQSGVMTAGLRSGNQAFARDGIDDLIDSGASRSADATRSQRAPAFASGRFIFNNVDIEVIMRGLDQTKDVDIMAQPQIVVRAGEKATFQHAREFIYATDYTEPQLPSTTGSNNGSDIGSFPVTPAHPTGFNTRAVGITLEVEATGLSEDRSIVDLQIAPELVEFDGFVNYGNPIMASVVTETTESGLGVTVLSENKILMPVFTKKGATTALSVESGRTVVFGQLLKSKREKFNDKVPIFGDLPLVGRLFRSEGERLEQKALIIMVKAEVIDPSGRPIKTVPSGEL